MGGNFLWPFIFRTELTQSKYQLRPDPLLQYLLSSSQTSPAISIITASVGTTAHSCFVEVVYRSHVHSQEANEDCNPACTPLAQLCAHGLLLPGGEMPCSDSGAGAIRTSSVSISVSLHPIPLCPSSFSHLFHPYLSLNEKGERESTVLLFAIEGGDISIYQSQVRGAPNPTEKRSLEHPPQGRTGLPPLLPSPFRGRVCRLCEGAGMRVRFLREADPCSLELGKVLREGTASHLEILEGRIA